MSKSEPFKEFKERIKELERRYDSELVNLLYAERSDRYNPTIPIKLHYLETTKLEILAFRYALYHAEIQLKSDE
jgi:hypothetical protein